METGPGTAAIVGSPPPPPRDQHVTPVTLRAPQALAYPGPALWCRLKVGTGATGLPANSSSRGKPSAQSEGALQARGTTQRGGGVCQCQLIGSLQGPLIQALGTRRPWPAVGFLCVPAKEHYGGASSGGWEREQGKGRKQTPSYSISPHHHIPSREQDLSKRMQRFYGPCRGAS